MPLDQARWQIDLLAADKTAQAFASVDRRMRSLADTESKATSRLNAGFSLATKALGAVGIAFSAAAVAQRAWAAGMKAADLGEQAEQIGATTDQLQAWRLVAAQAGVSSEQLDTAMMRLTRSMGEANNGADDAIARFDRLGVKLLDADGNLRRASDVLPEVARGLLSVGSETERNALMMDLFGRSGTRMVTILGELARGNDELVSRGRALGAITSPEAIAAWDKLADQLKVAEQQFDTLFATIGAPIAMPAFEALTLHLRQIVTLGKLAKGAVEWATSGTSTETLQKRADTLRATIDAMTSGAAGPLDDLANARLAGLRKQLDATEREIAVRTTPTLPPVTVTADGGGVSQPTGKAGAKAGAKLDERLRELQNERRALETALAAFDGKSDESTAAIDKRLDAQAKLDKKIFDVLKDVPPNSPLAAQLTQEAAAIAQLNQQLEQRKQLHTLTKGGQDFIAAQELERQSIGLSAEAAARLRYEHELLNTAKANGIPLTDAERDSLIALAGQMASTEAATRQLGEMHEFAKDTFKGLFQDVNQGLREGQDLWTSLGEAALNALGRISDKLIDMAVNSLFENAFGGAGAGGGIFGSIFSSGGFLGGLFGNFFADGGRPPVGRASVVGEDGWELFVPDRPGTIYNQDQLAAMNGGGSIVINQTMMFGSDVSQATLRSWGERIKADTMSAIVDDRRRGGTSKRVFSR